MENAAKVFAAVLIVIIVLIFSTVLIGVLSIAGCVGGYVSSGIDVVKQELDPHELLRKYNWFKDAAAVLDKKQADMKVYDKRFKGLEEAYKGKTRNEWARDDREQHSIWMSEAAGVRASYNSLAAEYNSNMAKEQWRFCEIGRLPQGATVPLPREFKPYEEN